MGRPSQLDRLPALGPASRLRSGARRQFRTGVRDEPLSWSATARAVLPAFVITRLVTLLAGLLGPVLWRVDAGAGDTYDPAGLTTGLGSAVDRLVAPYAHWDAVWFLDIANQGYPTSYEPRTAFFPLYPGILHTLDVFGSPVVLGLLFSTACAYGGAMFVHRLTALELDRRAAGMAVWVLLVFPGSLWLTSVYSEGLFLLVSAGCLYFARTGRWEVVAVLGGLAAATRSAGVVLVAPILVLGWQALRPAGHVPLRWAEVRDGIRRGGRALGLVSGPVPATDGPGQRADGSAEGRRGSTGSSPPSGRLPWAGPVLAATATVGGLAAFVLGLKLADHSWTVSFDQQQEWGRRNVGPISGIRHAFSAGWDGLAQCLGWRPEPRASTPNAKWMNPLLLVTLLTALAALAGTVRRLPPAYAAYAGCALLLPLSSPAIVGEEPMMSLPRFVVVLFPLAMWAGWWLTRGRWQRTRQLALGVVGLALLALFSELTARWLFVA